MTNAVANLKEDIQENPELIFTSDKVLSEKVARNILASKQSTDLRQESLNMELWREYDFQGRVYRIDNPQRLYFRPGGTTHRVIDTEGVCHLVPAPGEKGTVLRFRQKEGFVTF